MTPPEASFVSSFFTKYKDALITVSWVLAAISWLISNRQANQREKRKETRSEIDAICKSAAEIIGKCRAYYASEPSDEQDDARSADIAFEVHRIVVRTERLNNRVDQFPAAVASVGRFHGAVTAEPFQSKARTSLGAGSACMGNIENSVHELIDSLEQGFTLAFSNPGMRLKKVIAEEWRNWFPLRKA